MNQRTVFLDFDGCLVHMHYKPSYTGSLIDDFDPKCVLRIVKAIETIDAKVVVHSTWVHTDTPEEIKTKLQAAGFPLERLHEDWLCDSDRDKNKAIENWIEKHSNEFDKVDYCVVDDEKIGDHPQVKVSNGWFKNGFQDTHQEELIKAFN